VDLELNTSPVHDPVIRETQLIGEFFDVGLPINKSGLDGNLHVFSKNEFRETLLLYENLREFGKERFQ